MNANINPLAGIENTITNILWLMAFIVITIIIIIILFFIARYALKKKGK
jgi:heme/copper-type cytochrome/quinol oxidase subunit 2